MIRIILIFIIVFLVVRMFVLAGSSSVTEKSGGDQPGEKANRKKGVPREIGEYVEYEEIKKKG